MTKSHGAFVWHELMTSDPDAAERFYNAVVGFSCKNSGMAGMDYRIFSAGDSMVAGLMHIPEDAKKMGAPPNWSGYISVDDVDAATEKLKQLGGKVFKEPTDIPNTGRFSVVTDPQGAVFQLFKTAAPMPGSEPPPDAPGHVGWNELYAVDVEAVFPFYAQMFGWVKLDAIDMGPMGKYQMFGNGALAIGGMMNKPEKVSAALWDFYFNVRDIDAATASLTANGGAIVNGPMQVPGGQWVVQALDPQGALFALVGARG